MSRKEFGPGKCKCFLMERRKEAWRGFGRADRKTCRVQVMSYLVQASLAFSLTSKVLS